MDSSPILDAAKVLWPFILAALHFLGASAVTLHAILRKKNVQSAIAWIGFAWLSPLIGSITYLVLGINRIQRTGISLGLKKAWDHDPDQTLTQGDRNAIHDAKLEHPNFLGLVKLGTRLIGKRLLSYNRPVPNGTDLGALIGDFSLHYKAATGMEMRAAISGSAWASARRWPAY